MFVRELAMFDGRSCMLLRLFVLAEIVMMGRLMVMVRGSVVVSGRLMVMLTRRMLRCPAPDGYVFAKNRRSCKERSNPTRIRGR